MINKDAMNMRVTASTQSKHQTAGDKLQIKIYPLSPIFPQCKQTIARLYNRNFEKKFSFN